MGDLPMTLRQLTLELSQILEEYPDLCDKVVLLDTHGGDEIYKVECNDDAVFICN